MREALVLTILIAAVVGVCAAIVALVFVPTLRQLFGGILP